MYFHSVDLSEMLILHTVTCGEIRRDGEGTRDFQLLDQTYRSMFRDVLDLQFAFVKQAVPYGNMCAYYKCSPNTHC